MQPMPSCRYLLPIWARRAALAGAGVLLPGAAFAAGGTQAPGLVWGIPFMGMLLSIALVPLLAPHFWHRRMFWVAAGWTLALLLPQAVLFGPAVAAYTAWHAMLLEYLPFTVLLLVLFTAGGGILLRGGPWGTPAGNTLLLAVGTMLAGVMGTTGVSMVLIHPLLRANNRRRHKVHLVVFFILLVSNVGGSTTPLGDPPLYIGFLQGIPFFWPLHYLTLKMLTVALPLLAMFWLVDRHLAKNDAPPPPAQKLQLDGRVNILLLALVVAGVLAQGIWQPGSVDLFGTVIGVERLAAMGFFLVLVGVSLKLTPKSVREGNLFTWDPMIEVAVLFLAIFITIAPVLQMLGAGLSGPLSGLLALTNDADGRPSPVAYFWLTGILSAFLDNAPTWLVFFQTAGGDVARLTGEDVRVLQAISAGAVFFGALTYIGNAPNLMVRSIAAHRGVRMPGFFGYMLWSVGLLFPLFVLVTVLFFL